MTASSSRTFRLALLSLASLAVLVGCSDAGTSEGRIADAGAQDVRAQDTTDITTADLDGAARDGSSDPATADASDTDEDAASSDAPSSDAAGDAATIDAAEGGNDSGDSGDATDGGASCSCGPGADCVVDEGGPHCACTPVTFTKEPFADPALVQDCIRPDVCIARGDTQSIFNAAVETQAAAGPGSDAPAGTLWKRGTCAGVTPDEFGPFLSEAFANFGPPSIVDVPGCLYLPDYDEYYRVRFASWSGSGPGGGFEYERALVVADDVACP